MCSRDRREKNVNFSAPPTPFTFPADAPTSDLGRELAAENRRLWAELKEKTELTIALRDEVYFARRQLADLESREETQRCQGAEQSLDLIREINQLQSDLREKRILVDFLNEMVERLCDEVLQTEHVECMEAEIRSLECENRKLVKENDEVKVRLKIVEHDNEKLRARADQLDEENHGLKKKLEKTAKRLKTKENSMLSFKKFTELANNLQSRISRSKSENHALRGVVERMKNVANNYENLENENQQLKDAVREFETQTAILKEKVTALQAAQLKLREDETTTKPALVRENSDLRQRLLQCEDKVDALTRANHKLKANLKIYEKILIENKAYMAQQEDRVAEAADVAGENERLKATVDKLNETLSREHAERQRVVDEKRRLRAEHDALAEVVKRFESGEQGLASHLAALRRNCEEAESRVEDLRRQLQVYKNTVQNQDATLKLRAEETDRLLKENDQLKLGIKQYESQIQMKGKVYRVVR